MSNISVNDFSSERASSATWALCWKQGRELLAPMAVLTLGSFVLLSVFGFLTFKDRDFFSVMATVPATMSICFTFVCCFISFVTERENRTSSFLVALPLSSVHVGVVKILIVIAAVLVFCMGQVLMIGVGALIKWQMDYPSGGNWEKGVEHLTQSVQAISIFVAVTLVVSLFSCSLWSRSWYSVLAAMILGWYVAIVGSNLDAHFHVQQESWLSASAVWPLVGTLALLVVGAIWFPLHWLRHRPSGWARRVSDSLGQVKSSLIGSGVVRSQSQQKAWAPPRGGKFGALLWQSIRQQHLVLMVGSFFLAVFVFCLIGWVFHPKRGVEPHILPALVGSYSLLGLAAGWLTLSHDKKDNNREFFQQHREHGITFMIARIISPISILLVLLGVAAAYTMEMAWRFGSGLTWNEWQHVDEAILFNCLMFYSSVVLCSMIFRSQVYALGVALVVAIVGTGSLAQFIFSDSPFALMLALPVVWLISSVAYGPRWLSGRRSWVWNAYFTVILLFAFAVPIYLLACWLLGIELDWAKYS